ncbi:FAD-dependent oxidoreductase [Thermofilum pendens]|uniref:HI0933 family protein n=1 Tax=Thermofilum pendens (strain DSM 2475 / Hrk 5) TaxID=368408 RepID=A1RYQ8_THEPD|nr:FAD-dependent oxidoreductase [Thermofilum pendens]ABL78338.1 HI0933 family protein [Thermofilum pendens Hrk 5]
MRITEHPILEFRRGSPVKFRFDGEEVEAFEGESIAAALWASGIRDFRRGEQGPQGPFCMIGYCSGCMVRVDGRSRVRACLEPVRDGAVVEREDKPLPSGVVGEAGEAGELDVDVMVIGSGPAGLSAALASASAGLEVHVFERHFRPGGQLVKQTHKFFGSGELFGGLRGFQIAERLVSEAERAGVKIHTRSPVLGWFGEGVFAVNEGGRLLRVRAKAVVVGTGAVERFLPFPGNTLPGVMGAGAAQTLMNEYGVKPGEKAVVVGAGNVGLIVSYQLLQAGVSVEAVVEVRPEIGGWFVHAAKLRRLGVPILTEHTVVRAEGRGRVERVVISRVGKDFQPLKEYERSVEADLLLLAVGLTPESRLLAEMGARMTWSTELGGYVPYRDRYMETSIPGVYVAGDASGIEEATTALLTGRVAGLSAAIRILGERGELVEEREKALRMLDETRRTPFSARVVEGIRRVSVGVQA